MHYDYSQLNSYDMPYSHAPANFIHPAMAPLTQQHSFCDTYPGFQQTMHSLSSFQQKYPMVNTSYGRMHNAAVPTPVFNPGMATAPSLYNGSASTSMNRPGSSRDVMTRGSVLYPATTTALPAPALKPSSTTDKPAASKPRSKRVPVALKPSSTTDKPVVSKPRSKRLLAATTTKPASALKPSSTIGKQVVSKPRSKRAAPPPPEPRRFSPYFLRSRASPQKKQRSPTPADEDGSESETESSGDDDDDSSASEEGSGSGGLPTPLRLPRVPTGKDIFCALTVPYLVDLNSFALEPPMAIDVASRLWFLSTDQNKGKWSAASLEIRKGIRDGTRPPIPQEILECREHTTLPLAAGVFTKISVPLVIDALRLEGRARIDPAAFDVEFKHYSAAQRQTCKAKMSPEMAQQYFSASENLYAVWQVLTKRTDPLPPHFTPEDQKRTKKDLSPWLPKARKA